MDSIRFQHLDIARPKSAEKFTVCVEHFECGGEFCSCHSSTSLARRLTQPGGPFVKRNLPVPEQIVK